MERSLSSCSVLDVMGSQRPQYFKLVMLQGENTHRRLREAVFPSSHPSPASPKGTDNTSHKTPAQRRCTYIWPTRKLPFR